MKKKPVDPAPIKQDELVEEILSLVADLQDTHLRKNVISMTLDVFAEYLDRNPAFHRYIADPKSDLKGIEPIIKRIMKRKKQ